MRLSLRLAPACRSTAARAAPPPSAAPLCTRPRPKFFQAATQADFLKGDVENLSIDSHGQLVARARRPSWSTRPPRRFSGRWSPAPTARCSSAPATRARSSGSIRRARARCSSTAPSSKCTRSRRRPTAASTSAPRPTARSTRSIATARRRRSSSRDDKYIWALAVDAQGQRLRRHRRQGRRLQDRADGKGAPFYKTKATHATALAFDKAGNLLVGTGSPGKVLRVDADGKALRAARFAVPGNPRAALRRQGRALRRRAQRPRRAAAPRRRHRQRRHRIDRRPTPRARRSPSVSAEITSMSIVDARRRRRRPASTARGSPRARRARVYRIAPDGLWDQLWESRDDSPYDLTFDRERRADHRHRQQGQDLSARRRSAAADAARARERAAGHRVLHGSRAAGCTTRRRTPASCSACRPIARRAAPTSRNRATRRWSPPGARSAGAARRRPAARSSSFTRSGNTETPDDTWSAWSAAVHATRTARRSPARRRAICSGARS